MADLTTLLSKFLDNLYAGNLVVGTTTLSEAEIGVLDGVTAGTGAASKALVLDANADITAGLRSLILTRSVGVTTTAGLTLQNTTAAAAGAQQYSPGVSFIGQGWKTDATAASQAVETRIEQRPEQSTANPVGVLAGATRIAGGAWIETFALTTVSSTQQFLQFPSRASDQFRVTLGTSPSLVLANGATLAWANATPISGAATNSIIIQRLGDASLGIGGGGLTTYASVSASATGGAAYASHAISLAQDATTKVGTAPVGILTVVNTTDSEVGVFSLIGTGVVAELHDSSGNFTITKDNAATINVYYFSDGVYVQNKITATKSVRLMLSGV